MSLNDGLYQRILLPDSGGDFPCWALDLFCSFADYGKDSCFSLMRAWEVGWMCAAPMGMMAAGDQRTGGDALAAWVFGDFLLERVGAGWRRLP
jgi:hypothetical protein